MSSINKLCLNGLPNEVLVNIFRNAGVREPPFPADIGNVGYGALHELSMCSRRLHDIVEPLLYTESMDQQFMKDDTFPNTFVRFARTVITAPHLARHVRALRLNSVDKGERFESPNKVTEIFNDSNLAAVRAEANICQPFRGRSYGLDS